MRDIIIATLFITTLTVSKRLNLAKKQNNGKNKYNKNNSSCICFKDIVTLVNCWNSIEYWSRAERVREREGDVKCVGENVVFNVTIYDMWVWLSSCLY